MPALRYRLADQVADIGADACDHPVRRAGLFAQQRQMRRQCVGFWRKADRKCFAEHEAVDRRLDAGHPRQRA